MPIVTVQLARRDTPTTREQKKALAEGITALMEAVLGKRRESVTVLLRELDADDWAEGGVLVSELRRQRVAGGKGNA